MHRPLVLLLLLLSSLAPRNILGEEEIKTYRLTFLSAQEDLSHLSLDSNGEVTPLLIPSGQFPAPQVVRNNGTVRLLRKDEQGSMVIAGQVRLPAESTDYLLLVFPRDPQAGTVHLSPMDFSHRTFPPGAFRILNFTQRPVQGNIAGSGLNLEAGKHTVLVPKQPKRTLPVLFAYPGQSAEDSLLSTTWFYNPQHRYLVFLFPDEHGERVGIRTLRHFPKPEPPGSEEPSP